MSVINLEIFSLYGGVINIVQKWLKLFIKLVAMIQQYTEQCSVLSQTWMFSLASVLGLGEIENVLCKKENSSNPFLEDSGPKASLLDWAVDFLTTITSKRSSCECTYKYTVLHITGSNSVVIL